MSVQETNRMNDGEGGDEGVQGDSLHHFLSSCLKTSKHVKEVENKLKEEGIDYDTLYELGEEDLRSTLRGKFVAYIA